MFGLGSGAIGALGIANLHAQGGAGEPAGGLMAFRPGIRGHRMGPAGLMGRGTLIAASPTNLSSPAGTVSSRSPASLPGPCSGVLRIAIPPATPPARLTSVQKLRPGLALEGHGPTLGEAVTQMTGVIAGLVAQFGGARQRRGGGEGVRDWRNGLIALLRPGQGIQGQAEAHGRVAGKQVEPVVAREPGAGDPARSLLAGDQVAAQGQDIADRLVQALGEDPPQACPLHFVVEVGIEGVHVDRQPALAPQVIEGVLVAGQDMGRVQVQAPAEGEEEGAGIGIAVALALALVGEEAGILPAGLAIGPPAQGQGPARQLFAGVPLALAEVEETALAIAAPEAVDQLSGQDVLGGTQGVRIPLGAIAVVHRDEGGLAAHGQTHVPRHQLRIHRPAQGGDGRPLRLGVGLGHPRRFMDAGHRHPVVKLDLAVIHRSRDGRGRGRLRGAGHRDMPLPGQQAGGGVQADPAGPGEIDLAPGVQVGEIGLGAGGPIQGLDVGLELDEVAGDEARRQAQVA